MLRGLAKFAVGVLVVAVGLTIKKLGRWMDPATDEQQRKPSERWNDPEFEQMRRDVRLMTWRHGEPREWN